MNLVKMEHKVEQISPCYQIITGWLNIHTPSGIIYVEPCITLYVLQQIKDYQGLSVVVPAVSTSKVTAA